MQRARFAVVVMGGLLAACGTPKDSGSKQDDSVVTITSVSDCPSIHVVSCDHKETNTASGIPNDVTSHSCIERYSDNTSFGEAQINALKAGCDTSKNSDQVTYVLGTGCSRPAATEGCLNGFTGYCEVQWVMNDDGTTAAEWEGVCKNAGSTPVNP